jgi:uncharacterized protein YeeX (DUF496 family)
MDGKRIIETVLEKIKAVLCKSDNFLQNEMTPENLEKVGEILTEATKAGVAVGIKEYAQGQDCKEQALRHDGKLMRLKGKIEKRFLTRGGEIVIERNLYQADVGGTAYVPLDHAMGAAGHYALPDVRNAVAYLTAFVTPREVADILQRLAAYHPSEKAVRRITNELGEWLETHEDDALREIAQQESLPSNTEAVVVSMDGVNVLMREPGKKRGRPPERPYTEEKSQGNRTSYKNAMVGTISLYSTEIEEKDGKKRVRPKRLSGTYVARMSEERFPTFKEKLEREVREMEKKLDSEVGRIVLMDGALGLWKYVDDNPLFDNYEKLVDFFHATEHLSSAAEAIFGKGSEEGQTWYHRYRDKLKHEDGAVDKLLRSIDYYLKTYEFSKERREALIFEQTFFTRNASRMDYARFVRAGHPIGSGPVESACKTIVKQRLCRSGMRWSTPGGQHILSLRTIVKSNRWDALWACHCSQLTPNAP